MKRTPTIVVLVLGAAGLSWWLLGRLPQSAKTAAPLERESPFDPALEAVPTASARPELAGEGAAGTNTSATTATSNAAPANPPEWPTIQALLARPVKYPDWIRNRPRMREVPRLSPESEARLIDLYGQTNRLWPRQHIVRILAFGGDSAAAALLRRALTEEYAGQEVSSGESILLEYLPELMGILARHNDDALALLVEGSRPGYWENRPLWKPGADWRETHPGMLTGACIKGLALSGRPEFETMLDWYREHPESLVVSNPGGERRGLSGPIITAQFFKTLEREMGIEAAMDDVIYDPETMMMRHYERWEKAPAGKDWVASWEKLEGLGLARAEAARGSVKPSGGPPAQPGSQ